MEILRIPALKDNYIFLLVDRPTNTAAVVDPAQAQPVIAELEKLGVTLEAIFNTHHHSDHIGGNRELQQRFPAAVTYGGTEDRGRIPGQQVFLGEGDRVKFSDRTAQVFFLPGHTYAHIAYYFPPLDPEAPEATGELFCGDTLFAGGCGRLFEGTPAQMMDSLGKLRQLPDRTRVWCAHEYTLSNLKFALTVDTTNLELQARWQEVQKARSQNQPTIPSWLGIEKQTNPFLRWDVSALGDRVGATTGVQTFAKLRGMKDIANL
jgi:hydroxyacylglutathione hydrolase